MSRAKWFILGIVAAIGLYMLGNIQAPEPPMTPGQKKVATVAAIASDYHRTHTYSHADLFVCVDMAIDLWNQLQTKGINAEIKAGSIGKSLNLLKDDPVGFIRELDHVWILFEVDQKKFLPLETTGGFIVFSDDRNFDKYFTGFSFDNPRQFKRFMDARDRAFRVCSQAEKLVSHFNSNYAGRRVSQTALEAKGMVEFKEAECKYAMEELVDSIVRR